MGLRGGVLLLLTALALLAFSQCTFFTAGSFNECVVDGDCQPGRSCMAASPDAGERYCIVPVIPEGCRGLSLSGTQVQATYGPDTESDAIHIGAAFNFTSGGVGPISPSRVQHLRAVVMALNEINQRGVGNGRHFVLHVCDTQNNPDLMRSQVTWMADQLKAPAVLVPGTQQVLTLAPLTTSKGMVLMSPTATSTEITSVISVSDGGTRLLWRTAPSDSVQGMKMINVILGRELDAGLPHTSVGILYLNDPYGQGLDAVLEAGLPSDGGGVTTVTSVWYDRGQDMSDAGGQATPVTKLNDAKPNVTVLVGFADDAVRIVNAAQATNFLKADAGHRWFFSDAAKDPILISQTPPGTLEGSLGTAAGVGSGSTYKTFASSFDSLFPVSQSNYAFAANNYDAMYVIALGCAHALNSSGTGVLNGETLAQGLTHLSMTSLPPTPLVPNNFSTAAATLAQGGNLNIEGASGNLDFNSATGEATAPISVWHIRDGGIQQVDPPGP